ncbi:hypothetical protein GCM10011375_07830 [Hymenobacter qilianensis]|uniref:Uncharacterized protein n=1 Tax=Hymenobacter qilianensis TaxID=1385715 RepID=A0ACB5PN18_9BACT|nr:hypothetical protein GCM10011375_07830 [Hymenobacter qilianensis]
MVGGVALAQSVGELEAKLAAGTNNENSIAGGGFHAEKKGMWVGWGYKDTGSGGYASILARRQARQRPLRNSRAQPKLIGQKQPLLSTFG